MYFDIGANIGKWAQSNILTAINIIAVEASEETYQKLVNNCKNDRRIIPLNYAICDNEEKDIIFYQAGIDTISTINKGWLTDPKSRFYGQSYVETKCKTTTIDKLIEIYGKPSLIKIDVEGGEYECIKSLTNKVDLLCFEWASELADIAIKCLEHLHRLGFKDFYVQYCDDYTFRPTKFYDINEAKSILNLTTPKDHWGMIWCS